MSDMHQAEPRDSGANPLWGDLAALRRLFPDKRYALNVARRQALFGALIFALVAPFTILAALTRPLVFTSSTTIAFDPRDASGDSVGLVGFKQVSERLHNVSDARFIEPLVASVQAESAPESPVARLLASWSAKLHQALSGGSPDEAEGARRRAALERLEKSITTSSDDDAMILRISVEGDTPAIAKAWAARITEAFIQSELRSELERVANLEQAYAQIERQKNERNTGAAKASALDAESVQHLQEREAALADQIVLTRTANSEASGALAKRRTELQGDLSRLKTTLGPSHPDVLAKEDELQQFLRAGGAATSGGATRALQEELAAVRAKLRLAGAPSFQDTSNLFDVSTRLLRLRADKAHLEQQLKVPDQSGGRFRVSQAAFLPSAPKKGRLVQVLMAFFTTLALSLGLIVAREALSPRASDAWRLAAAAHLPVLCSFSGHLLRRAGSLTAERLDRLRGAIGERKMLGSTPVRAFLEYRRLVATLQAKCLGRRIVLITVGDGARTALVLYDFLRVYATETGDAMVVLDLDGIHPLAAQAHSGPDGPMAAAGIGAGDVCDLLIGARKWSDVRIVKSAEQPFDLVPPPVELTAEKVRTLKKAPALKLIEALERSYKIIFVRGFNAQHSLENAAFAAAATDIVLVVDGRTARRDDVVAAVQDFDRALVRGFVLVDD